MKYFKIPTSILALSIFFLMQPGFAQTSSATGRISRLWTVHIDEVDSMQANDFERFSQLQSSALRDVLEKHNLPVARKYEVAATGFQYLSFRPRENYAELDQAPQYPEDVKNELKENVYALDDSIHPTLRTHYNHIWQCDESSSYFGTDTSAMLHPGYLYIRMELVRPGWEAEYDSVTGVFQQALRTIDCPLTSLSFYSAYGDGAHYYVWLAKNEQQLSQEGSGEDILSKTLGKRSAEKLLQIWRDCLEQSDDLDAIPRRDLSSLGNSAPWFGIR